jgi:hypothetical protein
MIIHTPVNNQIATGLDELFKLPMRRKGSSGTEKEISNMKIQVGAYGIEKVWDLLFHYWIFFLHFRCAALTQAVAYASFR